MTFLTIRPSSCGSAAIFVSTGALPVHLASTPPRCTSGLKLLEPLSSSRLVLVRRSGANLASISDEIVGTSELQRVRMVTAFIHLPIEPSGY